MKKKLLGLLLLLLASCYLSLAFLTSKKFQYPRADLGRGTGDADAGGLQGGDLVPGAAFAAGDDGAGVAHALAGRGGDAGDIGHHRLADVGLAEPLSVQWPDLNAALHI